MIDRERERKTVVVLFAPFMILKSENGGHCLRVVCVCVCACARFCIILLGSKTKRQLYKNRGKERREQNWVHWPCQLGELLCGKGLQED